MTKQAATLTAMGRKGGTDQLSAALLFLAGAVTCLSLVGLELVAVVLIVAASLAVLVWAVRLNELSELPAVRNSQLRRLVRLRRQSECAANNPRLQDIPLPVIVILACLVLIACADQMMNARVQSIAHAFPSVPGTMTRYETVDVGMVGSQLEVEYRYTVDGRRFQGQRCRFVYRPYRVGTDEAKRLAANWGAGKIIPVFYDPRNPSSSAIDNTFCKGDHLFVSLNVSGIIAVMAVLGLIVYFRWVKPSLRRPRRRKRELQENRITIPLSNTPLFGTLGLLVTAVSLGIVISLLLFGLFAMADKSIPWLVTAIDWMCVITGGLFVASVACYLGERASYGRLGRICEIDKLRKRIIMSPEGFGEEVRIGFDQIDGFQNVSRREDWYRWRRTFSPTILYHQHDNTLARIILQRDSVRNHALSMLQDIRQTLASS